MANVVTSKRRSHFSSIYSDVRDAMRLTNLYGFMSDDLRQLSSVADDKKSNKPFTEGFDVVLVLRSHFRHRHNFTER